jgi:hypothetical protein
LIDELQPEPGKFLVYNNCYTGKLTDKIVTRYMDDGDFQRTAFPILAKEIFEAVHASQASAEP